MTNEDKHSGIQQEFEALQQEMSQFQQKLLDLEYTDRGYYLKNIYYLWILWADFHLHISRPIVEPRDVVRIIKPTVDANGKVENVYPIFDHGNVLSTSRGEDVVKGLRSMGKMYNTIDKMARLLLGRISAYIEDEEDDDGGIGSVQQRMDVAVAFRGHELVQRKAYVAITDLGKNIEIVNFAPGEWGRQLPFIRSVTAQRQASSAPTPRG